MSYRVARCGLDRAQFSNLNFADQCGSEPDGDKMSANDRKKSSARSKPTLDIRPVVEKVLSSTDVWDMTLPWLPMFWDIEILARCRSAGFTFLSLTLQDWPPTFDGMHRCVQQFKQTVAAETDWLMFGSSLADIDRGRKEGKIVLGLNSQETRLIEEDLSRVAALYDLGVRHMLLAYNVRNLVADGCAEASDAGLSNFGRQVVKEMNRVGIIVDGSHTGRRSSLEAIEISERPTIFSHSGVYAVCPHIRNVHDDQIRACAASGGVIGVVGVGAFVGDVAARTESVFRHIDYIAALVGPEYVGLGTDYVSMFPTKESAGNWAKPEGRGKPWPDPANAWPNPTGTQMRGKDSHCFKPEQLVELVEMMLARGYGEYAVKGILGTNFRRVYATLP